MADNDSGPGAAVPDDSARAEEEPFCLPKKLEVSVNFPELVQAKLASIWEDQKYTDITFLINGHRVPAHKAILASHSEYFERMLFGELREASMDEIPLENVSLKTFIYLLWFVYSGSLHMKDVPLPDILEVVAAADHFGFVELKDALVMILSSYVSLDNVIPLLVHSDTYHLQELHKKCLCFIENKDNTIDVLQSSAFLHLPEENLIQIISRDTLVAPELAIFKAVVQWKEHNNSSAEQTQRVLQHIRLGEFPLQEIFSEVEPSGLFSQESIMTALRLQYTPSVVEKQGRGRKEVNLNLFTKPKAVFDPTTPLTHHQLRFLRVHGKESTQEYVERTIFHLGFPSNKRDPSGSRKLDHCTMIVSLDDVYLVNFLLMKGYPATSDEKQKLKFFSYTVEVSRDKCNWLKLIDYSSFACRSVQRLPFPKQAVKYIKVNLTGKEDTSQPVPLLLAFCCYSDNQKPFRFLPNGVIAPQYELKVVTVPFTVMTDNKQVCVAYFRQPYSASLIKFQLTCSDPNVVEVDITVSAGVKDGLDDLDDMDTLQNMERIALQSEVIIETQERVIGYVAVIIRKVYKKESAGDGRPGRADIAATDAQASQFVQELPSSPEMDAETSPDTGPVFNIVNVFCRATT